LYSRRLVLVGGSGALGGAIVNRMGFLSSLRSQSVQLESVYDEKIKDLEGANDVDFAGMKGKVLLVVNVASK